MRQAETVTFGGSGLDRAAHLRGDAGALARHWQDGAARVLPVWRGKPLVELPGRDRLGWLGAAHGLAAPRRERAVFLGLDDGAARFAIDLSDWQPEVVPDTLDGFFDQSEQHHPDLPGTMAFAELRRVMAQLSPREAELAATAKALLGWHRTHAFCSRCGQRTGIAGAGWQSICPSCGGQHFPRTDPVVIMLITHGNSVLLGRSHGWPEGMYSLLAGFVEPGEPIEAAVRREVMEETGIAVGGVWYLASQPWPFPASLMLGCRGEATGTALTVDDTEIEDALWVRREQMLAVFAGESDRIRTPRSGSIAQFLLWNWLADRLD